ncbi:MAG: bifunctional hydroxymethylpyrimidine kinase/phosphomethylpyrimidine kinase [Butyricicoccaceae bacterium]
MLHHDAAKVLQEELFPLCTLVTPNLHEAAAVCSHNITNREDMEQAAREISARPAAPFWSRVVIWQTAQMICCLTAQKCTGFPRRVLTTEHARTGCTLSSAIACGLAWRRVARRQRQAGKLI